METTEVSVQTVTIECSRTVDPRPVGIRWLQKPDGDRVLQFAQMWQRGWNEGGIEWVDVPIESPADGVRGAPETSVETRNKPVTGD